MVFADVDVAVAVKPALVATVLPVASLVIVNLVVQIKPNESETDKICDVPPLLVCDEQTKAITLVLVILLVNALEQLVIPEQVSFWTRVGFA